MTDRDVERNLLPRAWDAIVIGTGLGGAAYGHALARAGHRVLFLEQGRSFLDLSQGQRGRYPEALFPRREDSLREDEILRNAGRAWRPLEDRSGRRPRAHRPLIGVGTGGSSLLYGMALERFFPEDFEPARWHAGAPGHTLPDRWPFDAAALAPYYAEAESLFQVHGTPDPLKSETPAYRPPAPLSPAGEGFFRHFAARGLHPYRLPIGYDDHRGEGRCQGTLCADGCKRDAGTVFLAPAAQRYGAVILTDARAHRLLAHRHRVTAVEVLWCGRPITLTAREFILGAGALETPALLLRSAGPAWPAGLANGSGEVGRHLLRHLVDLYAVEPPSGNASENDRKEIAFNDLALPREGKLGTVQSFGRLPPTDLIIDDMRQRATRALPGAGWLVSALTPFLRPAVSRLVERRVLLASILEDLPYEDNRVVLADDGHPALIYRLRPYDRARVERARRRMNELLAPLRYTLLKQAENNERIAHAAGTCRAGDNPSTSVVNGDLRAHELDNLRIVDASWFPSAGGTNPGLTIVAGALRAADRFLARQPAAAGRAS